MDALNFVKSRHYDLLTHGENGEKANGFIYHYFEADYELFDEWKCNISIFFPNAKDPQVDLDDSKGVIREQINWIISNKKTITDCLVDNGAIEFVERWMQTDKKNPTPLPITKDDIRNSLRFDAISVHFEDDINKPRMDICVVFDPGYCDCGCYIILLVDANKKLTYGGIGKDRRAAL